MPGCAAFKAMASGADCSDPRGGFGEHRPQDLLDLVEVALLADQRWSELHHRVTTVVGPAVEAGVEERLGQEAAQEVLTLLVGECLLGRLVLDQLDAVEVAVAPHVTNDREIEQLL